MTLLIATIAGWALAALAMAFAVKLRAVPPVAGLWMAAAGAAMALLNAARVWSVSLRTELANLSGQAKLFFDVLDRNQLIVLALFFLVLLGAFVLNSAPKQPPQDGSEE